MSRNSQTRRLALSVAVALSAGGGALFPVMPHAFAADVSGLTVTVDNPTDPQLTAPGISAGEINGWTDAGNVTGNTLTLSGVTYSSGNVHGGFTVGTGNAEGNKLFLKNGASINIGGWAVGGRTNNGGNATGNKIYIDDSGTGAGLYAVGGMTNGQTGNAADNEAFMTDGTASYLYGGFVFGANSTGNATGNKLTLSGGTVSRDVAGGVIQGPSATSQGKGDVSGSVVTISGGTVAGTTYGGTTQGIGSVKTNKVTVSGTTTVLHDVLGGRSMTGEVSGNTLDFKEATADNLIGGRIAGTNAAGDVATNTVTVTSGMVNQDVRGGEILAPTANGNVSGNKVNINGTTTTTIGGAVTAGYNMGTGNADGNELHITNGTIAGVVTGGHSTQAGEVSGNTVEVTGGTLSDNIRGGFAFDGKASGNKVDITGGMLSGNVIDGGFSVNGTASGNTATVGGVSFTGNVTGGSAAAGADTNKVILKNGANITGNAYGGLVGNGGNGGNVTGNELTIEAATVSNDAVGGQNNAAAGDVTDNKASMNAGSAGRLIGGVVNGVGATGKASGNRAEVSDGSSGFIAGALVSDTGAAGDASDNHAVVSGANAPLGSIYGAITNGTGAAKNNTATISGSITANDVVGGQSVTGNAEGNKANFTQATVTNVRGARITGSGTASAINNEATIAGGTVNGAAAAAEIQNAAANGDVQDNTLTVTGGTVSGDSYGGVTSGTGNAVGNGVVVSGGSTSLNDVYGGSSAGGNAKKNYVTYSEATAVNLTGGRAQSGAGAVSDNKVEMTGGSVTNDVTGGLSYGSGTVEKNEVKISGGSTVSGNILGGQNAGTGAASSNTVELTGGTINAAVYGGWANSGAADSNKVTVKKDVTGNIFGGYSMGSTASGNTVDLVGTVTVSGSVVGGQGSTADNNTVNLGTAHVMGSVTGGLGSATSNNKVNMEGSTVGSVITVGSAGGTGNTLTVSGTNRAGNITGFQKAKFDLATASTTNPMLDITNGWGTSFDWGALEVSNAEQLNRLVLMQNMAGISLSSYTGAKSVSNSDDTTEFNIDTENHGSWDRRIVSESYKYRLQDTPVTIGTEVFGGISKVANSTRENEITVNGSYTNAYGGYTDVPLVGTGTTKSDRDNSHDNKITLSGGNVSGTVYGGYTTALTGTTTNNTVNIKGGSAANVVGAYSAGDATGNKVDVTGGSVTNVTGSISTGGAASGNEITLGTGAVVTGFVMGGQGSTATNDNKINLEGNTTVSGLIRGGNLAGTGNTLTVKGNNTAGNITMFQKVKFDLDSASTPANAMLALTGGSTGIDWGTLEATGTATGARTLLSNTSGFGISGYTTDGTFVSETDEHEYFIDTDTHTAAGTKINLDDYQFKNANVTTLADPNETWAGRSKRGNTTQDNKLTITGGTGTNAYGGWTSTGSTTTPHPDKFDSKNNTVNLNGGSITNVYGGYTTSAGGKATGNTVNVAGGTATNVVGGESIGDATKNTVNVRSGNVTNVTGGVSTGAASDNTINLGSVYVAGSVLGGLGTVTNDNKVNVEGTTVAGSITAGSVSGTGNKLTVKSANTAGSIAGFNKVIFDTDSATTNPMLTLNGGTSFLDWQTLEATGTSAGPITLMHNGAGISFGGTYNGAHSRSDSDDTTEFNIDTVSHTASDNDVIAESYKYRGQTNAVASPAFAPGNVYGGISKVGNATRENEITVSSGSYTDAFGGYTEVPSNGSGKAQSSEKENSHDNKITIAGANVSGTVYGGYTTSTTGSATKNKVEVTSGNVNNIVGGYALGGAASNNEITLKGGVTVGSVLGGQGAATTDNKVNLEGATVTNAVTGGSVGGTGHELTVRNTNAAGSIVGFEKLKFDVGTAGTNPMLTLTGGPSAFDWTTLEAIGTTAGPVTLMENGAGISFGSTYDGAHSGIDSADTTEFNIDTENRTASDTKVIAQSYQYRGQTNAVTSIGTDVYGGISRVANATRENNITVSSGSYTNAYGGYTDSVPPLGSDAKANSAEKNNSHDNTITIAGANVSGTVYGGYTNAAAGTATKNKVEVTSGNVNDIVGGYSVNGAASENTINLGAVTVTGNVTGGEGTATNDNKVNVEGTTVNGVISGGNNATSGNTLTVKGANSAGNITAFQNVIFDASSANAGTSMLTFTGGANALDWQTLDATGTSTTPITLMENGAGISFGGTYDGARSKINGDDTTEYNIDTENRTASDTKVIARSYQYKGVTAPVTPVGSTDVYGGISKVGNATRENNITVSSGSYTNAYGGYTDVPLSGTDAKALSGDKRDSHDNSVTIDGATVGTVYGGYATSPTGKATKNTVNITSGTVANAVGGYSTGDAKENTVNVKSNVSGDVTGSVSTGGAASANVVSLDNITVGGNVTGGSGATTEDNIIHLNKTTVTGNITGGTAASGTGNTLVVHPGASKAQSLAGIQNINFFLDDTHDKTAPVLELTTTGTQNLQGVGIGVGVIDGAHPAYRVNEQFSLIKAPGGTIQTDPTIRNTSSAMQGVSLRYEFDVAQTAANEVSAVVKKAELIEQTKSFVETRAGATAFINQGVDFLVANNIQAAKDAASAGKADEATAPKGYQLWAGIGGNRMHSESGSYVETNGWNVGVGWARENALKDGKAVYGPFLSYGNGSYDSYLNDNTHGSGKFRTFGLGVMARFEKNDGMWYEGSLQGGRVKSDYSGSIYAGVNSSYDVSNTYWSGHLGAGKDIQLKDDAKITPYLRYFWSHQGGVTAHLNTNEDYDFSEVTSHRTRLGFRYTRQNEAAGEFYTGLAWEYEFSGSAHASYQGYDTPSPSLKGSSGMLELGYRFIPADSRMRYDLRLTGWQGKRRGLSGDLGVKWMF